MKVVIAIFSAALVASVFTQYSEKVHVTILYESLCPDSIDFIQNQLKPSYPHLKDFIDINFVPFGKSTSFNEREFICQHGEKECIGNKIQSCALDKLEDQTSQVSFVTCQMVHGADIQGQQCSESVGLNYQNVLNCFYSEEGTKLQLGAEVLTGQFAPKFIPTIVYNHQFKQDLQDRSLTDFSGVICDLINNSAPICSGLYTSVTAETSVCTYILPLSAV